MNFKKAQIFTFLFLIGCDQRPQVKTEYHLDSLGNKEYKTLEYQYILNKDNQGNEVEIRHGLSLEFYRNGKIKYEVNFSNGLEDGITRAYFNNGQIFQLANHKAGNLDGKETLYYSNGNLKRELLYKEGLIWKAIANYDSLGIKIDELTLDNGNGSINTYYENSRISSTSEFRNGLLNGKSIVYYETGQEAAIFFLLNGKKDGELKLFHENGLLEKIAFFKNDIKIGEERKYNKKGILISKSNYQINLTEDNIELLTQGIYVALAADANDPFGFDKGILEGSQITYYENGKIKSEEFYLNGKQDSVYREYYENGKIKEDVFFDDSYQNNRRYEKNFDKNGKLTTEKIYLPKDSLLSDEQRKLKDLLEK